MPQRHAYQITLFCLVSWIWTSMPVQADDWPQWLGPNRDAVWRESGIVDKFPTTGLPVRWRFKVGQGYSGPAVAGGRVFVTDRQLAQGATNPANPFAQETIRGGERVLCLNEADGKVVWQYRYERDYSISYPAGPRATPLVHGGKVYTLGAQGDLLCLDIANGNVNWSHDLQKDYHIKAPVWGFAGNPLLDGNRLICLVGGKGSVLVAFDKDSGKELWRALSSEEPGYSSPVIYEASGKRQLILWHPESVNSVEPETGKLYWSVPFKSNSGMSIATPRRLKDELFVTCFYNGSLMLRLATSQPGATPVWQTEQVNEKDTTHLNAVMCTPVLEDDYIYGICSYGQLRCLKASTGERVWETLQPTTLGNPVRWANAFIVKNAENYFLFNEKGDLIKAHFSPAGYHEISRTHLVEPVNTMPGRPVVWSHPAFANRCVFVRNDQELVVFDLSVK